MDRSPFDASLSALSHSRLTRPNSQIETIITIFKFIYFWCSTVMDTCNYVTPTIFHELLLTFFPHACPAVLVMAWKTFYRLFSLIISPGSDLEYAWTQMLYVSCLWLGVQPQDAELFSKGNHKCSRRRKHVCVCVCVPACLCVLNMASFLFNHHPFLFFSVIISFDFNSNVIITLNTYQWIFRFLSQTVL